MLQTLMFDRYIVCLFRKLMYIVRGSRPGNSHTQQLITATANIVLFNIFPNGAGGNVPTFEGSKYYLFVCKYIYVNKQRQIYVRDTQNVCILLLNEIAEWRTADATDISSFRHSAATQRIAILRTHTIQVDTSDKINNTFANFIRAGCCCCCYFAAPLNLVRCTRIRRNEDNISRVESFFIRQDLMTPFSWKMHLRSCFNFIVHLMKWLNRTAGADHTLKTNIIIYSHAKASIRKQLCKWTVPKWEWPLRLTQLGAEHYLYANLRGINFFVTENRTIILLSLNSIGHFRFNIINLFNISFCASIQSSNGPQPHTIIMWDISTDDNYALCMLYVNRGAKCDSQIKPNYKHFKCAIVSIGHFIWPHLIFSVLLNARNCFVWWYWSESNHLTQWFSLWN